MEPSQYEVPASLKDGTAIIIRAIRPDDSGPLREQFVKHLSTESVRLRFHGLRRAPTESEAFRLTNIDFVTTWMIFLHRLSFPLPTGVRSGSTDRAIGFAEPCACHARAALRFARLGIWAGSPVSG